MKKLLHFTFFLAILILSCSNLSEENSLNKVPCPLNSCQKTSIEVSLQGLNYSAPFTCYEWINWGTGMNVGWTDNGRILFFTFPNHRICNADFRICAEDICNCEWQPIEDCSRNNTLTVALDSCLFGQATLYLDVFLQDK